MHKINNTALTINLFAAHRQLKVNKLRFRGFIETETRLDRGRDKTRKHKPQSTPLVAKLVIIHINVFALTWVVVKKVHNSK